jgi:hypothetical protein
MTLLLAEIAATVASGAHAALLLVQAEWHGSDSLIIPPNITLMPLPSKCHEPNPVKNICKRYERPTLTGLAWLESGFSEFRCFERL